MALCRRFRGCKLRLCCRRLRAIYHTTDAGLTWNPQTADTDTVAITSIVFSTYLHGVGVGTSGHIWYTFNGGMSWVSPLLGLTSANFNALCMVDSVNGFLSGTGGYLAATTNAGVTWNRQSTGINLSVNGVKFSSLTNGFAVGLWGTVLSTIDGGTTWALLSRGSYTMNFRSVCMTGGGFGVAAADNGKLMMTPNFGVPWEVAGAVRGHITNSFSLGATNTWVITTNGSILFSSDSARTFTAETSHISLPLNDIMFVDPNNGFVCASGAKFASTTDGGSTWVVYPIKKSTENLLGLYFLDAVNGFVVGTSGRFSVSGDGGQTWNTSIVDTSHALHGVYFTDINTGWVVGSGGTIYATLDGGNTWTKQTTPVTQNLWRVKFTDANVGWVVGDKGIILSTTNGGNTWAQVKTTTSQTLFGLSALDSSHVWIAGQQGGILAYGAGAFRATPLTFKKSVQPGFRLENYPNPFNPATTIAFTLPQASVVTVTVYNVLGQEVAMLARNQAFAAGRHELSFAPSTRASGLYFARLASADGKIRQVLKMLLIK